MVLLVSTAVQMQYWTGQQRYLARQTALSKKIDATILTEEDLVRTIGRLLAADTILVQAYVDRLRGTRLRERKNEFDAIQGDWDRAVDVLELRLRLYFPSEAVKKAWQRLKLSLGTLDDDTDTASHASTASDPSELQEANESFKDHLSAAEGDLRTLTGEMDATSQQILSSPTLP